MKKTNGDRYLEEQLKDPDCLNKCAAMPIDFQVIFVFSPKKKKSRL
jgi:hypothetical protein